MKIEFEIENALEWSELKLALEQRLMHVIDVYGEENPTADAVKELIHEFTIQSYRASLVNSKRSGENG